MAQFRQSVAMGLAAVCLAGAPCVAAAQTLPAPVTPTGGLRFALVKDGVWYSMIAEHSGKALEIPLGGGDHAPLQQAAPTGADNQLFRFDQVRSGFFRIVCKASGEVLEIKDGSLQDHARVQQSPWTGQGGQLFTLVQDTDGSFQIVSKLSGYAFDVLGGVGAVADGVPVVVYPPYAARNHKFKLVEAPAAAGSPGATGSRLP